MLEEQSTISIIDYLDVALRRKWFIIIPFLTVLLISVTLCFVLPKKYKATTTILVIPQNVPDAFVKSTVTMNPSEYLNILYQEIMSRTRLEKVIKELSLFPRLIQNTPIEDIIARMRENIEIDVKTRPDARGGVASFSISYIDRHPQTVADIANRLASLFIEENMKSREQQAKKTTDFLVNELQSLEARLLDHEKAITNFKQQHIGSLPEQREANLRMLDQLILQQQRIADELSNAENRKIVIQQQLYQMDSPAPLSRGDRADPPVGSLPARISETKRRIIALQNKYTDAHPDIIAAKSELAKLLAQANRAESEPATSAFSSSGSAADQQLLAINLEIKSLQNEFMSIKSKTAEYQARVEMAPRLEQELTALARDYENTKKTYDNLLTKRHEAEQAEKLEITQRGEQFKVLDPAKVPFKPFKPNRPRILLMGIALALAAGGGAAFLVEFLDKSFYQVNDLESYLGLPVLVSLPVIAPKKS